MESQLLGFPPFPHFVISMACFGNAYPKITVAAKACFREQEPLVRDGDYWPVDFLSIVFERETFIPARLRIRAHQYVLRVRLRHAHPTSGGPSRWEDARSMWTANMSGDLPDAERDAQCFCG